MYDDFVDSHTFNPTCNFLRYPVKLDSRDREVNSVVQHFKKCFRSNAGVHDSWINFIPIGSKAREQLSAQVVDGPDVLKYVSNIWICLASGYFDRFGERRHCFSLCFILLLRHRKAQCEQIFISKRSLHGVRHLHRRICIVCTISAENSLPVQKLEKSFGQIIIQANRRTCQIISHFCESRFV